MQMMISSSKYGGRKREEACSEGKGSSAVPVAVLARRQITRRPNSDYHTMTRAPSCFTLPAMSFETMAHIVTEIIARSLVTGVLGIQTQEGGRLFKPRMP